MQFELFTKEQKEIYTKVHNLEHELMESIDPTNFVLNPKTVRLRHQLDEVRANCDHIYENGVCAICGKEQEDYK